MMKLESQTLLVNDLDAGCVKQMLRLMQAHYEGVSEAQFLADLSAKQWIILLCDGNGQLCGFSTQVLFDYSVQGQCVKVLFSGDTIIEKSHWGSMALPVAWGRLMLSLCAAQPESKFYWLLTSKGYKTYRFLPVFFRRFYPGCDAPTPAFEQALLDGVAGQRFGERFDPATGLLRADASAQRLREGVAEIDAGRLRDRHVAFFQQRNPRHASGDELVCLAQFCADNLNPYILRQL